MPFTFPSHPGLILPLWVRRPDVFDGVALFAGSVVPDFIDLGTRMARGGIEDRFAHSLLGLVSVDIPLAFALVWVLDAACRWEHRRLQTQLASMSGGPRPRGLARRELWLRRLGTKRFLSRRVLVSAAVGAVSHLVFDALSHDRFEWLLPWTSFDPTPAPLKGTWARFWLRGLPYDEVKLGIFGVMWVALTLLGAVLFVWEIVVAFRRRTWR